jgi:hypothetical protein
MLETALLPSPQDRDHEELPPTVEERIGSTMAALASCLAVAMAEYQAKESPRLTCRHGGELIGELIPYKMTMPGFDAIAREHGRKVLYAYRDVNVIPLDNDWLDQLIERSLEMLSNLLKRKAN